MTTLKATPAVKLLPNIVIDLRLTLKRQNMLELVQVLTSQLGVQEEQAKGGAGLLFELAKSKLADDQFSQISQYVPGINEMLGAAPKAGGGMAGALGGLASAMGAPAGVGNLAAMAGGFSKLGLNAGMLNQFIPIVISYVQSKGGAGASQLLAQVLK